MAAITGNMTSEDLASEWQRAGNSKAISMTIAIPSMVMCPIIIFGNLLVILSVWIDPLKKLRPSPSNHIIVSMAIADLLVGLVVCGILGLGHFTTAKSDTSSVDFFYRLNRC